MKTPTIQQRLHQMAIHNGLTRSAFSYTCYGINAFGRPLVGHGHYWIAGRTSHFGFSLPSQLACWWDIINQSLQLKSSHWVPPLFEWSRFVWSLSSFPRWSWVLQVCAWSSFAFPFNWYWLFSSTRSWRRHFKDWQIGYQDDHCMWKNASWLHESIHSSCCFYHLT